MEFHVLKRKMIPIVISSVLVLVLSILAGSLIARGESEPEYSGSEQAAAGRTEAERLKLFTQEGSPSERARIILDAMTDEEIIAQIFLLGYAGTTPGEKILEWIRRRNPGGVKIFGWNSKDLSVLAQGIATMQKTAAATRTGIPLVVATDQEGGWVRHVKGETAETPGNMALGASGLLYDAFNSGYYIANELRTLGINMNFAPTIDIFTNIEAQVIGPRAFSEDPRQVALLGYAFFKGERKAGVISTAKHFPGHGNAAEDSHGTLPVIEDSFEAIEKRELVPYAFLIREGIPAIMSGHLAFPKITGDSVPATLSRKFITEILREKLGFNGVIVTDDLFMNGVRMKGLSTADICIRAIEAGNNMLMLSLTPELDDEVWTKVTRKYFEDEAFRNLVRDSAFRILALKLEYLRGEKAVPLYPDPENLGKSIPDRNGKAFFFDQACRSVTVIRGERLPLTPATAGRVLIVSPMEDFFRESDRQFPGSSRAAYQLNSYSREEGERLLAEAAGYDTVIFCTANETGIRYLQHLKSLSDRIIVFSVLSPAFLRDAPWVKTALAVFGWSVDTYRAGYAVLKGEIRANGKLPISIFGDSKK